MGILTNGFAAVQRQKLDQFSVLRERSKSIVISEEFGHMKPDTRIFHHASEDAGVDHSNVLYFGDSFRSDVAGGTQAGWQVAWLRSADHPEPPSHPQRLTHIFTSWDEFDVSILNNR